MSKDKDNVITEIKNNVKVLINNGQVEEAKALLREYIKLEPDDIECYSISAVIEIMKGKLEDAEEIIKKGLYIDENNFDLLYNLAFLHEQRNNITEALAAYRINRIININNKELVKILDEKINGLTENTIRYKVILFGDYNVCLEFRELFTEWNIVGICTINKMPDTISIGEIKNIYCDFVFVLQEFCKEEIINAFNKNNIDKNVYFLHDFKTSVIEGLDYKVSKLLGKGNVNGIITGLSYAEVGIKEDSLPNNFINFALSAQDLYYDFQLVKYIYMFKEIHDHLQYAIINLGYYSFDYDMTKTISKYRVHRYCRYFNDYHNNKDIIGVDITRSFYEKAISFSQYLSMNKKKEMTILSPNDTNGEYEALRNSTMNYPDTRNEYEDILDNYLLFLKNNNIKPIIVICPASSYYRNYFDKSDKKITFYNILNKFKKRYSFQILDYFESDLFTDSDFWDYSHLNGSGAKKFTEILSNEIVW